MLGSLEARMQEGIGDWFLREKALAGMDSIL